MAFVCLFFAVDVATVAYLLLVHFSRPFKAFLEEGEGDWAKMLNTTVSQQQKILDYTG